MDPMMNLSNIVVLLYCKTRHFLSQADNVTNYLDNLTKCTNTEVIVGQGRAPRKKGGGGESGQMAEVRV